MRQLLVQLLAFMRECIEIDLELRKKIDQCVDPSFGLEKFIEDNDLPVLQNAITTLECASFVTDNISAFFYEFLYFI